MYNKLEVKMTEKQMIPIEQYGNIETGIDTLNAYLKILKCFTEENATIEEVAWIDIFMDEIIQEINMLVALI